MTVGPFDHNGMADPMDGRRLNLGVHPGGLPVRHGDAPSLIDKAALARAGHEAHYRSMVFEIPKDIEKYVETVDWITKMNTRGAAFVRFEERTADRDKSGVWHIFIGWVELRGTIPKDPRTAR